ncbi:unnamed protein product [Adineta ricciae]|uniref:Uncharacterized protein n=1 Tax=Adineta ricciae TaxID=249248 RepID=A0A815Q0I9_ADIRI|nr:unnamed protein product [Adineta ricciae]CAF1455957.1 unnamed protein product [Adineta ricciae]
MVTKNTKFEAKLARYLISDPGDQLLGYDACIERQGSAINYRLIVLGLESIYLTDNPPKIAQLEQPYIHYRDILRVEMIDDYPEFLSGNEKLNTLHMRLRVIMPLSKDKKNKKKKSKSTSVDNMETIPSLFDRLTLENINAYMENLSPRRSSSNRDLYQAPLPQLYAAIPPLLSPLTSLESTMASAIDETDPLHLPLHQLDDLSATTMSNTSTEFQERLDQLNLSSDRSHFQRLFSSRRTLSDEPRSTSRSKSARSLTKKKTNADSDWLTDTPRLNRYVLQRHEDDLYGTLHTPRSTPRQNNDESMLGTARSTLTDLSATSSMNSTTAENSGVYCPSIEEVHSLCGDLDDDMKDIDIYFLSLNAKIPEILSAALSNHIIVSTLRYDGNRQFSILSTADRLQSSMDLTMRKFSELKSEILQSHNNSNQLLRLTDELYNACEKYAKVKELFWKDTDLFVYYIAQFHSCSQFISKNEYDDNTLNLSFSIMQLFNQIFLNTFASTERLARLTHDQCSRFQLLAECLLTPPITILSAQPASTTSDDSIANEMLKNTYKLVLKWMFISGAILWQIGDILSRPSWTAKNFRFQQFIELFEKKQEKDDYFDLFIDSLSKLTMNNDNKDPLSPKNALYVYQLFSILSMILINSTILSEYLRDRYLEDFKYFLKEDVILSRIPVQYPVYRFIPDLVRGVHHRIIYGEPNLNPSNRTKHRQLI